MTDATLNLAAGSCADLLALAAKSAHVAVAVSRMADGRIVGANEAFCRLYRYAPEQVIGRTSAELGLWPDLRQREQLLELVHRSGHAAGFEARYRNGQGETGEVEISAQRVELEGVAHLVVFLTEVSEQREIIEGLRDAQTRLGLVMRASGLLVFRQDAELRYTWVANPALGASESELLGRTDEEVMGAEAAVPLVTIKRRVLESGQAERRDIWVGHKGQRQCFDLVVEPERDAAGRVVGIVCAAQDITLRVVTRAACSSRRERDQDPSGNLEQRVVDLLDRQWQESLNAIEGMVALISHEPLGDRQALRLQRVEAEGRRLAVLKAAIRDLLRIERGTIAYDGAAEDFDPASWLNARLAQSAPDAAGPGGPAAGSALSELRRLHAGVPVLMAAGNPVVRERFCALLESAGLRVAAAVTGVEAFSLAMQMSPALVLLDVELPQRGGVAAARAIHAMATGRRSIIALLTGGPGLSVGQALDAELDDVLPTAIPADRLYEKVLAWLAIR